MTHLSHAHRVLVVDDDPAVCRALRAVLAAAGYEVVTAFAGDEAVGLARTFRPHVVIIDLGTPVIWGAAVAERLREVIPAARSVMITGREDRDNHAEHFDRVLAKPIDPGTLRRTVGDLIG